MQIRINHSSILLSAVAALVTSGCVGNDNSSKSNTGGSSSTAGGQNTGGKGTAGGATAGGGSSSTLTSTAVGGANNAGGASHVGGTGTTAGATSSSAAGGTTSSSVGGMSSAGGISSTAGGTTATSTTVATGGARTATVTGGTTSAAGATGTSTTTGGVTSAAVGGTMSAGGTGAATGGATAATVGGTTSAGGSNGGANATGGSTAATTGGATSTGGTTGAAGSPTGGAAPQGGVTSAGGTSATGGASSTGGSTSTCGANGQACCAAPADSCQADLTCLLGASCSCAKGIFGSYIIRADGVVLQMPTTATGAQTPVLDAATAQPLTGAVSGMDASSSGFGCLVKDDGTVWCWRTAANGNTNGGLGNGATDTNGATFRATQVLTAANAPLTNAKSMGQNASCAVTNDGKLYCWGYVTWAINNGTSLISPYAQAITTDGSTPLTGVQQASYGGEGMCALVTGSQNNEAWCWGYNGYSELGTGDTINRHYPTKILGLTNPSVVAVSGGGYANQYSVCAVDGENVLCWGYNGQGQTGIGNKNTPVTVPTLVKLQDGTTPLTGAIDLYVGTNYTVCALHSGNTLWCWGNYYQDYADTTGLTNVVSAGSAQASSSAQYLTSDGLYHLGTVAISPKCGSLQ